MRSRRLPVAVLLAYVAPAALLTFGLGAALSIGRDEIPTWLAIALMVLLLAIGGVLLSWGPKRLPAWQQFVSFPLLLGAAVALDANERLFPVPLAIGAALAWAIRRAPTGDPRNPASPRDGMLEAASPHPPAPGVPSPWAGGSDEPHGGTSQPISRQPQDQPITSRVSLAGAGTIAFLAIVSLGVLVLGGWTLHSSITGTNIEPPTAVVRVIGGFFGLLFTLLGLAGTVTVGELLLSRGQSLEITAAGIERRRLSG